MLDNSTIGSPRRLVRKPLLYVSNEVIITTVPEARNDDLPHFADVRAGAVAAAVRFDDSGVDGILARTGHSTRSVSRVFLPKPAATARVAPGLVTTAAVMSPMPATYDDEEESLGLSRTYRVTFNEPVDVFQLVRELEENAAVQEARPNYISAPMVRPSAEFYEYQWGPLAIGCEEGWEIETGHPDVVVGIVDSGVDLQHEDLAPKLLAGADLVDFQGDAGLRYVPVGDYQVRDDDADDEDGHGSHVAGIAAAASEESTGVVGVCWGGSILPVRVLFRVYDRYQRAETSIGTDADIDAGIKFAVDGGAHVINLSLGGPVPSHEAVLQYAHDKDVVVLAATGNANSNAASYPASNPNVLAVGAIDPNFNRAPFSNYGPAYNRFVMAPGVEIASTYKDNQYVYLQGTSMATPFVTGLAALIVSVALRNGAPWTAEAVRTIIRETATPLGSGKGDVFFGEGLINVPAALAAAQQQFAG